MRTVLALLIVGFFTVPSLAWAEGDCSGGLQSVSTPAPTTTALDSTTKPVPEPKSGG